MLLEIRDLVKDFGGLRAVNGLSFAIAGREILGLIGPNGSGKTTCINVLAGYENPTTGKVIYGGEEIQGKQPWKIAQMGILRTYQTTHLFATHSVLENMVYGSHMQGQSGILDAILWRRKVREERDQMETRAMEVLKLMGLDHSVYQPAASLSPGHQRALAIALALVSKPELLLLDEPAAGLSVEEGRNLVALIERLRDSGIGILLVDHDMRVIMAACDRIVVIDHGSKVAEGTPEEVRADKEVIRVYMDLD